VDLGGRIVKIQSVSALEDLSESSVIFVSASEKDRLGKVIRWAEKHKALTIADSEGFADKGIFINFYLQNEKIRFEINKTAADKNGFQISSLLLKVSKIVGEK
jgi:hypothetical protein